MKKLLALFLTTVMVMATLSGCGSDNKETDGETTAKTTEAATNDKTTEKNEEQTVAEKETSGAAGDVTIWYYWETEGHQVALDAVVTAYNESQSDIKVTAKYVPFADFKKQLSIGASAAELPDIVIIDAPDHACFHGNIRRSV